MSILTDKHVFYSYNDVNGQGINPEYLTTYSKSIIFDPLNRALYAGGEIYGNHDFGTYHGEIFNDFSKNHAYGDYSSASGHVTTAYNESEYAVGRYNLSKRDETIFTVGNGKNNQPANAFEIHSDNTSYINGNAYVDNNLYIENDAYTYHDLYVHNDLHVDGSTYTDGDYDVNGYFHVHDYLQVDGNTYLNDVAYLYNGAYTYNQSYVIGSSYIDGDEGISGSTYTGGNAYVTGNIYVNGSTYLEDKTYLNSQLYVEKSSYVKGDSYTSGIMDVTGYLHAHDNLDIDGVSYFRKVSYIENAYVNEAHINGRAYLNDVTCINSAYIVDSYTDNLQVSEAAYLNGITYIKQSYSNEAWVDDIEVKTAYSYTMSHISSYVGNTTKNMVKTMGLGQFYIWTGTESQLPPAEERYDNVIYLVLDEMPSTERTYTDI